MKLIKRLFSLGEDDDYKRGMDYFNAHQYYKSIDEFKKVLEKKTTKASLYRHLSRFYASQAYRNLGTIAFAGGRFGEALKQFKKSLELNPEHVDLNFFMGICLNNLGEFEQAMNAFQTALSVDPDHLPTQMKLAVVFHNMKMWDKAVSSYRKILEQKPQYADIHYRLGLALLGEGDVPVAARSFETAIKINPNYTDARIRAGMTYAHLGETKLALTHLQSVVDRFPEYADVYNLMALVQETGGRRDEAVSSLEHALEINPQYKDAKINLAALYVKLRRYADALQVFESAARSAPEDKNLQLAVDVIQKRLNTPGQDAETIAEVIEEVLGEKQTISNAIKESSSQIDIAPHFTEMISLINVEGDDRGVRSLSEMLVPLFEDYIKKHPTYPDLHHSLGTLYVKLRQFEDAEKAFQEAVRINPDYINARINLLKALKTNEKYTQALPHGEFVLSKGVEYPDVFLTLGEVQFALGFYDEALANAGKALEKKPSYAQAYYLTGKILELRGQEKDAIFAYEQCVSLDAPSWLKEDAKAALERLKEQ